MRYCHLVGWLLALIVAASPAYAQTTPLLLFGGSAHKDFLGCLNCNQYDSGSVCNQYGAFGSKYQSNSIWNPYGTFGSKYSASSPWNSYSNSAPVIVDRPGKFYGYLSANKYHSNRTQISVFYQLADLVAEIDDLDKARDLYCGD
jgi:hypothetical protein